MSNISTLPYRKIVWVNIVFFAVTTLLGLIAAPIYLYHNGISVSEAVLMAVFMITTPLAITMGYHRLFAHMSYKAHPILQFLYLFFGAAAFEQSAYKWASQHRIHHRYADTDRDPYSIQKGFFHAHIGWLIFWRQPADYSNVRDLERNRMIMHQHTYFKFWAVGAGIVLPMLIGFMTGHTLGALLLAVCLRLTLVYHFTFCINSVCHMFGKATYDIYSSARDHWFAAVLTFGEGYHNYHHHFPADYRNGVRWFHWDPTKWLIASLAWVGLAYDLKKISRYKILAARLRAQHQHAEDGLKMHSDTRLEVFRQTLKVQYEKLKKTLADWEQNAKSPVSKFREARDRFQASRKEWELLYSQALRFMAARA